MLRFHLPKLRLLGRGELVSRSRRRGGEGDCVFCLLDGKKC